MLVVDFKLILSGVVVAEKMNEDMENTITAGKYLIINRKKYCKLHLLTDNSSVYLGKDKINLDGIIGHPFWSTFKMIPKHSKREFTLTVCKADEILESDELLKSNIKSGSDNRNIWDDGSSQQLSTEEIIELRDSGLSSQAIVGCLIENSKTFHNKTEYSQEKYLKKKGTKYFEYLTIKKPTVRLLSELFYSKDPMKILGLRTDSLSQIITAINLQPDGKYVLYENGSQGLVAATILNYLSESGKLIYITPGKHPQQHAILAMNFNSRLDRLKCISLSKLFQGLDDLQEHFNNMTNVNHTQIVSGELDRDSHTAENDKTVNVLVETEINSVGVSEVNCVNEREEIINGLNKSEDRHDVLNVKKRKTEEFSDENVNAAKKPRWELEAEEAINLLKSKTSDGLIIVCKEYPTNLFLKLLNYIEFSRQFVLFNLYREPLTQLYSELKTRRDIINLKLTENWLRSYQVLLDRTHPDVLMTGNSGHLLTGTIVNND